MGRLFALLILLHSGYEKKPIFPEFDLPLVKSKHLQGPCVPGHLGVATSTVECLFRHRKVLPKKREQETSEALLWVPISGAPTCSTHVPGLVPAFPSEESSVGAEDCRASALRTSLFRSD